MKKFTFVLLLFAIFAVPLDRAADAAPPGGGGFHGGGGGGGWHGGGGGWHGGGGGWHGGGGGWHGGHGGHGHGNFSVFFWGDPFFYPFYYYPYYYPYPYYPYSPSTVVVPQEPQEYIQQTPREESYWYYCRERNGYYPYVKRCPSGWLRVVPSPPPQ